MLINTFTFAMKKLIEFYGMLETEQTFSGYFIIKLKANQNKVSVYSSYIVYGRRLIVSY